MLAVVSGVLLALSFPRVGHPVFAWIALLPLLISLARAASALQAFRHGLVTGVVFFAGTIYWIPQVMSEFGGIPSGVSWVLHLLFVSYLALFPALFAVVMWVLTTRLGLRAWLCTPVVWVASELGRIYLFTGFPWELLGYSQTPVLPVAQLASVVGVLGLSALVAWVNGVLAYVLLSADRDRWAAGGATVVLLAGCVTVGSARVRAETLVTRGEPLRVAAVQGNIAQDDKWNLSLQDAILEKYLDLTHRAANMGATLVVWPEAATPFAFQVDTRAEAIRDVARDRAIHVLFGTTDVRWDTDARYYNAAVMVDPQGETAGVYHKQHLVPWGEYVPLRDWLFFVSPLVEGVGGFSAGTEAVTLPMGEHLVGTAVCYEIIYPGLVRELVTGGSRLLTTVTNDAWYGRTAAPYQHFQMATMRAIENGRYLVRAANTGVSGVIDPYGRVLARTALFEDAVVTADVRLLDGQTVYTRVGDRPAFACFIVTVGLLGVAVRRRAAP